MKRYVSQLLSYITGLLSGLLLMCLFVVLVVVKAPSWLVVEDDAHQADIAVVLGGGGGSRLRKGLSLYDAGLVNRLLLVDIDKQAWAGMLKRQCPECQTGGKDMVFLEGSSNTFTDALLVAQYTESQPVDSLLVVTDPYHTRRSLIIFESRFKGSGVEVSVVNSSDFVDKLSPADKWWRDNATANVIWGELSRIVAFYLRGYERFAD